MAEVDIRCPCCEQTDSVKKHGIVVRMEPRLKRIIARAFCSRSKKTFCKLLKLVSRFNVAFWCTDGYRAYNDALPTAKHIVGTY